MTRSLALVQDDPVWERLARESDAAFHAFTHFRDLGHARKIPMALAEHKQGCGEGAAGAISHWEKWSAANDWLDRAGAWDAHLDGAKLVGFEAEAIEMGKRHAAMAMEGLAVLSEPARLLLEAIGEDENALSAIGDAAKSEPKAFLALLEIVKSVTPSIPALAKMEREARGVSGELEQGEQVVRVVIEADTDFRL